MTKREKIKKAAATTFRLLKEARLVMLDAADRDELSNEDGTLLHDMTQHINRIERIKP